MRQRTAWELELLGQPRLVETRKGSTFPSAGYCLIAALIFSSNHRLARAEAAALLWDSAEAHGNLRQLLLRMRRAVGGTTTLFDYDDQEVWLVRANHRVDAAELLHCKSIETDEQLRAHLDLYGEPLLATVRAPSEAFLEQLKIYRHQVSGKFFSLAEDGLQRLSRQNQLGPETLHVAEVKLLALDPMREETYQILISAFGNLGLKADARRIFGVLGKQRETDHDIAPTVETRATLQLASASTVRMDGLALRDSKQVVLPRVVLLAPTFDEVKDDHVVHCIIEDVANNLARYRSFTTLAAHSSFQATHDGGMLVDNTLLRADYSVSSFVRHSSRLELCVRLVSCKNGVISWSAEYAIDPENLIMSTRKLVSRMAAELSDAIERSALQDLERTKSVSAYLHFLRGQDAMRICDLKSVRRARKMYINSIKEDGGFAEAYAGLSNALFREWMLLGGNQPGLLVEAAEIAETAIGKDRLSSHGFHRLAATQLYSHKYDEALSNMQKASALHPNSAEIIIDTADLLDSLNNLDEAWAHYELAVDLNPSPPDVYWWTGASIAFSKGEFQTSLDICRKVKSEEAVVRLLAATNALLGNLEEAKVYGDRVKAMFPGKTAESMIAYQPGQPGTETNLLRGLKLAGVP